MRTLLLSAIFVSSVNAQTNTITFQSPVTQTALLELYTSEGCSSCPPAEAQLSRWKTSPWLWKNFVPVAFHVDYWDYLGWRDPWATAQFSDRQRAYAQQWRSDTVYTPGFVLNGREFRDWGRKEIPPPSDTTIGVLTATSTDLSHWQISFVPANSSGGEYEVHSAILASGLSSDVKAGENRGRRLNHDFVALTLATERLVRYGDSLQGEIQFQSIPQSPGKLALAVWITRSGRLEPLQATGGRLH
jgi:hypothetical protein